MIDLSKNREEMLAEIGASEEAFANRVADPSDPAFLDRDQASVIVRDTWAEILPRLRLPLTRRFANIPPERFIRDVGRPLKMGLGNADKRGNLGDPHKMITVEVVVTRAGAVIAISDEGCGFDFTKTLHGLRHEKSYFTHKGGGFKAFERAGSSITFADGGRTLLIRFLPDANASTRELSTADDYMKFVLRKLPMITKRGSTLESCETQRLEKSRAGQPEVRYALDVRDETAELGTTILTGRVLSETAAAREYSTAKQLYKGAFKASENLRVPKPMAVFKLHPRLVLYRFDPTRDLREVVVRTSDREQVTEIMKKVGAGLRMLHRSDITVDVCEESDSRERRERTAGSILRALAEAQPDRVPRAQRFLRELEKLAPGEGELTERVPVHGSFGQDCVRLAADRFGTERLYIYRFGECRLAHPGVDLGGILADLAGPGGGRDSSEALLESYLGGDSPPWLDHLPFLIANAGAADLERAVDPARKTPRGAIDAILDRCERTLSARSG